MKGQTLHCNKCHAVSVRFPAVSTGAGVWGGISYSPECAHEWELSHQTDTNELQLLVIDLQDCCVVKVEKGDFWKSCKDTPLWQMLSHEGYDNETLVIQRPFADVRESLDSKPVPRIQRYPSVTNPGQEVFFIVSEHHSQQMFQCDIDALSQLAGHPLPIWEPTKGEWKQLGVWPALIPIEGVANDQPLRAFADIIKCVPELPFKIWRYTAALTEGE